MKGPRFTFICEGNVKTRRRRVIENEWEGAESWSLTSGPAETAVEDRTRTQDVSVSSATTEEESPQVTHLSDELSSAEELAAAVDHLLPLFDLHTHTHT